MRKKRTEYRGSAARQRRIIDAALSCFAEMGFVNTTMEDIRKRSGASNGSIYHHFISKELLAAAVYLQGIADYQAQMVDALDGVGDARDGICALCRRHLRWVREHPDWARFLFQMRHADFMAAAEDEVRRANQAYDEAMRNFFVAHIRSGALRRLSRDLYASIIFGPCQEVARLWLATGASIDLERAAEELGESAWRALRT